MELWINNQGGSGIRAAHEEVTVTTEGQRTMSVRRWWWLWCGGDCRDRSGGEDCLRGSDVLPSFIFLDLLLFFGTWRVNSLL